MLRKWFRKWVRMDKIKLVTFLYLKHVYFVCVCVFIRAWRARAPHGFHINQVFVLAWGSELTPRTYNTGRAFICSSIKKLNKMFSSKMKGEGCGGGKLLVLSLYQVVKKPIKSNFAKTLLAYQSRARALLLYTIEDVRTNIFPSVGCCWLAALV